MTARLSFRARAATLTLAALLLATPATLGAQKKSRARGGGGARRAKPAESYPDFGSYPAPARYGGTPAPVRLRTRRDRLFRTRLREDSREGPNFAGHYTVVFWGCGTGCAQVAVVNAKTGLVYWPPIDWVDIPAERSVRPNDNYRLDSRLLVLTRSHYDRELSYTAYFYVLDRNRFRLVRRAERKRNPVQTEDDSQGSDPPYDHHD